MNEFVLYEQLCELEDIANFYPDGVVHAKRFRESADRIVSRLYRVGVIGEFKRGKSSLVNAIIGAEVLPTDILPMTAAVTRVTYGTERRILILYKDGTREERTLEELIDFATKYDPEKERTASRIREIQVTYPSVFCRNHIDLIDTPGLNDNEAMTNATLSVLGNVDAALMVISANAPLSITEQNLILSLIEHKGIRHIIFAVTHIDTVSSRASRQDEMIRFIQARISGEVLSAARNRWAEAPYYLEKAERILSKPDVYGVSSVLAMEGFVQDDEELLQQSRFPHFKNELLTLLTAAQSEGIQAETVEAAVFVRDNLANWHLTLSNQVQARKESIQTKYEADIKLFDRQCENMKTTRMKLDSMFKNRGFDAASLLNLYKKELGTCFINKLAALTSATYTDRYIRGALIAGARDAVAYMERIEQRLYKSFIDCTGFISSEIDGYCGSYGEAMDDLCIRNRENQAVSFPEFFWTEPPVPDCPSLVGVNVMEHVNAVIQDSLVFYAEEIEHYIASWKQTVMELYNQIIDRAARIIDRSEDIRKCNMEEAALIVNYTNNQAELKKILAILEVE